MNQQLLKERFEYKDGQLIYKITTSPRVRIGNVAGTLDKKGHRGIKINNKRYYCHRLVWMYHNGDIPIGIQIDHINRVKDDNRIENLRLATSLNNSCNSTKRINNKSGYKGVSWSKVGKKWLAQVSHNYEKIYLGYFDTPELAHAAYVDAATKLHKDFACVI
jgi:hypothetical protein